MSHLYVLDESAVKRLQKAVESKSEIMVWVGDWLAHLNIFSDAVIYDILKFIKPELERFEFEVSKGENRRPVTLGICDSRWVSFTGIPLFIDTKTSEYTESLDEFAVTHIICDIAALRKRMLLRQGLFNDRSSSGCNELSTAPNKTV